MLAQQGEHESTTGLGAAVTPPAGASGGRGAMPNVRKEQGRIKPGVFRVSTHLAFASKWLVLRSVKRLPAAVRARLMPR